MRAEWLTIFSFFHFIILSFFTLQRYTLFPTPLPLSPPFSRFIDKNLLQRITQARRLRWYFLAMSIEEILRFQQGAISGSIFVIPGTL